MECIYDDWLKTGEILFKLKQEGIYVPLTDALITAIALRKNTSILTLDKHFGNLAKITSLDLYSL